MVQTTGAKTQARPGTVYVLFDANDVVLYVGMTRNGPAARFAGHAGEKEWWFEAVRAEFHHYSTEYMTRRAEAAYIELLKPVHNIKRPWTLCSVCRWNKVKANGRCGTCLSYFNRYGVERPERLIVRHGIRVREEQIEKDVLRRARRTPG